MTDIVERLRNREHDFAALEGGALELEAADVIERLQSCLHAQESVPALYAEIGQLRDKVERLMERLESAEPAEIELRADNERLKALVAHYEALFDRLPKLRDALEPKP